MTREGGKNEEIGVFSCCALRNGIEVAAEIYAAFPALKDGTSRSDKIRNSRPVLAIRKPLGHAHPRTIAELRST
jgi:hypothetical protein